MKFRIVHKTQYSYSDSVSLCHNEAHLTPRSFPGQSCLSSDLSITPPPSVCSTRTDFFGNTATYFGIEEPHSELIVVATSEVLVEPEHQPHARSTAPWSGAAQRLLSDLSAPTLEARQYLLDSPLVCPWPELAAYAAVSFREGLPLAEVVSDLMQRIHVDFVFDPGFTTIATPLSQVFEHRRGVCQDFAHLAIACLRSQGLAARYVSGYIETLPPPGQEKLVGADASHAWFSVFDPDAGWLDFDPTNNQIPMDRHITTAWGRDYSDITPLKGVIYDGGPGHQAVVSVDVSRIET